MQPIVAVDWEKVDFFKVTLERPFGKSGGLRWRQGTTTAKKNFSFNAHDPNAGPPFWPGAPIMWPEEGPAIAGDPDKDSFIMPAEAAFTAFGHFFAPLEVPRNGIVGFTQSDERSRVAAFWNWYKMPPGDGTMNPPMNRIGPPQIPHVALRPLSKNMLPIKDEGGNEVVIRPFEFWKFDDQALYDMNIAISADVSGRDRDEVASLLSGFTSEEVDVLRELVKQKVANGKKQA